MVLAGILAMAAIGFDPELIVVNARERLPVGGRRSEERGIEGGVRLSHLRVRVEVWEGAGRFATDSVDSGP